jgi:hypothetical protein
MFKKKLVLLGLVLFAAVFLAGTVSFADELSDIQAAIKAKGAKWVAGETSMMKISKEERKKRLGLILDLSPIEEQPVALQEQATAVPASLDWETRGLCDACKKSGKLRELLGFRHDSALEPATVRSRSWSGVNLDLAEQILASATAEEEIAAAAISALPPVIYVIPDCPATRFP